MEWGKKQGRVFLYCRFLAPQQLEQGQYVGYHETVSCSFSQLSLGTLILTDTAQNKIVLKNIVSLCVYSNVVGHHMIKNILKKIC